MLPNARAFGAWRKFADCAEVAGPGRQGRGKGWKVSHGPEMADVKDMPIARLTNEQIYARIFDAIVRKDAAIARDEMARHIHDVEKELITYCDADSPFSQKNRGKDID